MNRVFEPVVSGKASIDQKSKSTRNVGKRKTRNTYENIRKVGEGRTVSICVNTNVSTVLLIQM